MRAPSPSLLLWSLSSRWAPSHHAPWCLPAAPPLHNTGIDALYAPPEATAAHQPRPPPLPANASSVAAPTLTAPPARRFHASAPTETLDQLYEPELFFENVDFRALHSLIEAGDADMAKALIFGRIRNEASQLTASPLMADPIQRNVLDQHTLHESMAKILAVRLASPDMPEAVLEVLFRDVMEEYALDVMLCQDIVEMTRKDPAIRSSLLHPFLFFKGLHAVQLQRIAHRVWLRNSFQSRITALALQSRMSEALAVDLHPGAVLGPGLFLDHAHGVVVGETATVGARCTILHGVTLGASGKKSSDPVRHPQIGDDVVMGAHCCVLGNVRVGDRVVLGAHAISTKDVDADKTVVGLNKVLDSSMVPEGGCMDNYMYDI